MKLNRTSSIHQTGVNILVYGAAGSGKTSLIPTLPSPLAISAEGGLLSISAADVPFVEVTNLAQLREAYLWITKSKEAEEFQSIALDSISEIAEVVLSEEKKTAKDPRQAYGAMQEVMTDLIRSFRDLPKTVYFTAKLEKSTDEMGKVLYAPSMPGNKLGQLLPYYFDEVLALRVEKDADGKTYRVLQAQPDGVWQAKDRSGKLQQWNEPDLGKLLEVIKG